ncbi:stearoyl-CoA desaturase 5-like isoform X2 [Bacillus rossius redtenbacheri]
MAPEAESAGGQQGGCAPAQPRDPYFERWWSQVVWRNVAYMSLLHGAALYALLTIPIRDTVPTHVWSVFSGLVGGFGVTAGAHRLWTHRSFKADTHLRVLLALCYSMAGENTIFEWVRDHRVHHKFSETDADPHNARRGFFFAHMGWLMMRKHPEVVRKGRQVDMADILADPVVRLHTRYFTSLKILCCFVFPVIVPHYLWGETWYNSVMLSIWRYVLMLNANWLVNSAAHIWGYRPYDKRINPAENMAVSFLTLGEGWHNYHHVFPWDYRAAELGTYFLNMTTFYLDMFAKLGWAHDLKCPSPELVEKVARRYGDGSHPRYGHVCEVKEDEDPGKKVLYPSPEDNWDEILSEYSTTDVSNGVGPADVSQSQQEAVTAPNDNGSTGDKMTHLSQRGLIYKARSTKMA